MRKEKYIVERKTAKHYYLQISITYRDSDGKQQTWSKTINVKDYETPGAAMSAAVAIRDQQIAELRSGHPINHIPTVGELYERTRHLFVASVKTWKRHCIAYNHSIKQYASTPITEVKAADIQQSLNDSIKTYSADATGRVLAIWRQIYRAAIMDGVIVADQTQVVHMPRDRKPVKPKKDVMISPDDFNAYLHWLEISSTYTRDAKGKYRKQRIIYILQIMYHTGMRPAEVLALSADDFDLTRKVVHVTKSVGSTGSETRQIVAPKTDSSVRDVPIDDILLPIVTDMLIKLHGQHPLYNYACRLLLERCSWYLRDNDMVANIILSSRGTNRDGQLISYIKNQLIDSPDPSVKITNNVFTNVTAISAGQRTMLSLPDICATSLFLAYEKDRFGFTYPCFMRRISSRIYKYKGQEINYGIKYFSADMSPDIPSITKCNPCHQEGQ